MEWRISVWPAKKSLTISLQIYWLDLSIQIGFQQEWADILAAWKAWKVWNNGILSIYDHSRYSVLQKKKENEHVLFVETLAELRV